MSSQRRMPQTAGSRGTSQGVTEESVMKLVKKALEKWNCQPRTDQDRSGVQCYSCKDYGHFIRDCPGIRSSGAKLQEN